MKDRNTYPTLIYKGKHLHSPYDPEREAEKLLSGINLNGKSLFIMFEPGLGYPVEFIKKKSPRCHFIIISPLNRLVSSVEEYENTVIWTPSSPHTPENFLLKYIHESDLNRLAYIPWPPAVRNLEKEAQLWSFHLKKVIQQLKGNHENLRGFGKKYLRNSLINYLNCPAPQMPLLKDKHVLITASGPTLNLFLKEIKKKKMGYFIIALPSSVKALSENGIEPNLIISTDAGFWAIKHFEEFPHNIPVGAVLSARILLNKKNIFPLIKQDTPIENSLLWGLNLPKIPTAGSVALSAVLYCLKRGVKSLTLAGLDLSMDDIQSHVKPHSFDSLLFEKSQRTNSIHNIYFSRALQMTLEKKGRTRLGQSLSLFKEVVTNLDFTGKLFRLNKSTPPLDGWIECNKLIDRADQKVRWESIPYPDIFEREKIIQKNLVFWQQSLTELVNDQSEKLADFPLNQACDFLYTLTSEKVQSLRTALFQKDPEELKVQIDGVKKEIRNLFNNMEELFVRISE